MSTRPTWMVRAGRDAAFIDNFIDESKVAIGWAEIGPVDPGTSRKEIYERHKRAYPGMKDGERAAAAGTISRFLSEIAVGDTVVTTIRRRGCTISGRFNLSHAGASRRSLASVQ